jgi:hypothetical protein
MHSIRKPVARQADVKRMTHVGFQGRRGEDGVHAPQPMSHPMPGVPRCRSRARRWLRRVSVSRPSARDAGQTAARAPRVWPPRASSRALLTRPPPGSARRVPTVIHAVRRGLPLTGMRTCSQRRARRACQRRERPVRWGRRTQTVWRPGWGPGARLLSRALMDEARTPERQRAPAGGPSMASPGQGVGHAGGAGGAPSAAWPKSNVRSPAGSARWFTMPENAGKPCGMPAWSDWSDKTLESNMSHIRMRPSGGSSARELLEPSRL